jgi:hypothetical protein
MMDSQQNSNANNLSQSLSQQQGVSDNQLGNPLQSSQQHSPAQSQQPQQQAQHENNSNNYYYRDTQPLKLETYPDLPLQCYQTMDEEESDSEVRFFAHFALFVPFKRCDINLRLLFFSHPQSF